MRELLLHGSRKLLEANFMQLTLTLTLTLTLILTLPLTLTLTKQAHVELAARLKKRDPGSAPNVLP